MVAGAAVVIVLAALLFARWVVQLAQRAERFEVESKMERVLREGKDAAYVKLDTAYKQLQDRYAALARRSVSGATDAELVEMLGRGDPPGPVGNRLLDPFEDDHGSGTR